MHTTGITVITTPSGVSPSYPGFVILAPLSSKNLTASVFPVLIALNNSFPSGGKSRFEHTISFVNVGAKFKHACYRRDPSARGSRMHQLGTGDLGAVRKKQVERFETAPVHRDSQVVTGVRDQV